MAPPAAPHAPRALLDGERAVHPGRAVPGGLAEERVGAGLEVDGDRRGALADEAARAERARPSRLAPPSPASIAMLCETPDMFGISSVTGPGGRGRLAWSCRRAGRCGLASIVSLPAFSTAGLPAPGASTALASSPVSLPGLGGDLRDVGGDVAARSRRSRGLRHRAFGVRVARSGLRRRRGSCCARAPSAMLARKASSRFGPDDPLGVRRARACGRSRTWRRTAACRRSGWRCRRP